MATTSNTVRGWINQDFEGGWSTDLKVGIKNSHALLQSLNFRDSPSQLTVLQQPSREDNGVLKDLLQNEVMVNSGETYSLGANGYIYTRSTAGIWSNFGKVRNGYFGMDYNPNTDAVYVCSDTTVSLINPISTGPTLNVDHYGASPSTFNASTIASSLGAPYTLSPDQSGSTNTISILTNYAETQTQSRFFISDIEPLSQIAVNIANKGTGNWTLTLMNGSFTILGTSTVTNANLTSGQFNNFVFSTPIRLVVSGTNSASGTITNGGQIYHYHLTSTVGDGSVYGTVTNDLSSSDMELYANRLISQPNGIHAMSQFQNFECIGNYNYLSVWTPLGDPSPSNSEWQRHRLVFPPQYQVCGLAVFNEYLAIACERVVVNSDTLNDGIIYFWDGLASTYNYFLVVPEGSPQAIYQHKNVLYYYAGTSWYAMASVTSLPVKIRHMPNASNSYTSATTQTRINPYAITNRQGNLFMAWPSTTTNTTIPFGVYSYGSVDKNYPDSFGVSYLLSTGSTNYSTSNNLSIGMVRAFGNLLHVSWQDNLHGTYGVDMVDNSAPPVSYANYESLIFDNGYVGKQKQAYYMDASWLPLPNGVTIVLKYSINRGAWIYSNGTVQTSLGGYTNANTWFDGDGYAKFDIGEAVTQAIVQSNAPGRFNEIQIGLDIYCSGATVSPTITSVALIFDTMNNELLQ